MVELIFQVKSVLTFQNEQVSTAKEISVWTERETPATRRTAGGAVSYEGIVHSANQQRGTTEVANHRWRCLEVVYWQGEKVTPRSVALYFLRIRTN